MPRRTRIPNPLRPRLSFVKQTYESRPEVYLRVTDIVKEAAGLTEIGERDWRPWEKQIGKLGTEIGRLDKSLRKGKISEAQFERGVESARSKFLEMARAEDEADAERHATVRRKVQRRAEARKSRAEEIAAKTSSGYQVVAPKLVGGHVGVEAMVNRDAPRFPQGLEAQKRWVAENAPFQQWLGVQMGNCLQFYKVNYVAYGAQHFETQRSGGKLYAVLSKDGKPVAAVLAMKTGRIKDANGPGNRSPSGLAQRAMLQLIEKMELHFGKRQGPGGNQLGVERADIRLEHLFEYFVDYWPEDDLDTRDLWMRRVRLAASQNGFEFEPALRKFLVYVLVGSKKYSALASVKKTDYPKKREIEKVIVRVARLIQEGASERELGAAPRSAAAAAYHAATATARMAGDTNTAPRSAADAAYHATALEDAIGAFNTVGIAADAAARAANSTFDEGVRPAARNDYAAALLYFVEQQAQAPRRRRRQNPSTEKVPTLKQLLGRTPEANPRRKKTVRKPKADSAAALKSECRQLWDHYCERPGVTRLRKCAKHCEKMAESAAKSVKQERQKCMRAIRAEAKARKFEL